MIIITSDDLRKLELIDFGTVGSVYRFDEKTVYKIYHDMIKTDFGERYENPALKYPKRKVKLLEEKRNNIKYTDFFIDPIKKDKKFKGFSFQYNNEGTVEKIISKEAKEKIEVAFQILRNRSELIENYIYPCDCSPSNIMLHNGEVKFIDLDDFRTIVTSNFDAFHHTSASLALGSTILKLFSDFKDYDKFGLAQLFLERKRPFIIKTRDSIRRYIEDKSIPHDFLIVTEQSDIELIKGWISQNPSDILIVL